MANLTSHPKTMNWCYLAWGLAFAVLTLATRIFLIGSAGAVDGFFSLIITWTIGSLFAAILWQLTTTVRVFVVIALTVLYVGVYRYLALFGVLPDAGVVFYFSELSHLSSSIFAELDWQLVTSILVVSTLLSQKRWFEKAPNRSQSTAMLVLVCLLSTSLVHFAAGSPTSKSTEPLTWWLYIAIQSDEPTEDELLASDYHEFLRFHGVDSPSASNQTFPLCINNSGTTSTTTPNNQSVIILILENVGVAEMAAMPNLTKFAEQNYWFRDFLSVGTKSIHSLPSFFSGLPPNPHGNYLWQKPIANMPSFVQRLTDEGYNTAYFHGSDLSFEQQRIYLKQIGFKQIFEFGDFDYPTYGWGYDDRSMLSELQDWTSQQQQPFVAALATVSTHHPFILPDAYVSNLDSENQVLNAPLEQELSYRYVDHVLGDFFKWYEQQNALLVIVGDHAPDYGDGKHNFNVPLIVAGLADADEPAQDPRTNRQAIGYDIPNTLLGLLGQPSLTCSPGKPLFAERESFDRIRYTVAGNTLEGLYFHDPVQPIAFNRQTSQFHKAAPEGGFGEPLAPVDVPPKILDLFQSVSRVHFRLLETNTYVPPLKFFRPQMFVPGTTRPIFVAHRGNTNGENRDQENTAEAIQRSIDTGMQWVEIDIQTDRDGEPFLFHDPTVVVEGKQVSLQDLSFDEIQNLPGMQQVISLREVINKFGNQINLAIEVKPIGHISRFLALSQRLRTLINDRSNDRQIIVDGFQPMILQSLARDCRCEIGFDHPFRTPVLDTDLDHYAQLGFDWIYIEHTTLNADLIDRAHARGIKVMGYTINTVETLEALGETPPDGVITDYSQVAADYLSR